MKGKTSMKIIYLAAHIASHPNWDVTYQDIITERDIGGDMMDVDLTPYDVIIATPPCVYWSRALSTERRRLQSKRAQETKYLLPGTIRRLMHQEKPFIIENVRNYPLFKQYGIFEVPGIYTIEYGRHTYWTNIPFNPVGIKTYNNGYHTESGYVRHKGINLQGGQEVHNVIEYWLEVVKAYEKDN